MNVGCDNCSARYQIPDHKVQGRRVRITCKRCGKAVVVDGTVLAAGAEGEVISVPPMSAPPLSGSGPHPLSGATRTDPAPADESAQRPKAQAPPRPGVPRPGVPRPGPTARAKMESEWLVELSSTQQERMTTAEVVELYARGTIETETRIRPVAREDWRSPFAHPKIADALRQRGFASGAQHSLPKLGAEVEDESDVHQAATINASAEELWRAAGVDKQALRRKQGGQAADDEIGEDDETSVVPSSRYHDKPEPPPGEEGVPVAPGAEAEPGDDDLTLLYRGGKKPPFAPKAAAPKIPAPDIPEPEIPPPPAAIGQSEQDDVDALLEGGEHTPPSPGAALEPAVPAPPVEPHSAPTATASGPYAAVPPSTASASGPYAAVPPSAATSGPYSAAPVPGATASGRYSAAPVPSAAPEPSSGGAGAWLVALVAFIVALLGVAVIVYLVAPQLFTV